MCFLHVDVLCSLSGIFRDSFANVLDLLDDLFEKVAVAEGEPVEMNFIKKHVLELQANTVCMHMYTFRTITTQYFSVLNSHSLALLGERN